jgi:hypothetical protein
MWTLFGGTIQYRRSAAPQTQETPFFPFNRLARTIGLLSEAGNANRNKHSFMFCLRHAQENNISSRLFVFMLENRG